MESGSEAVSATAPVPEGLVPCKVGTIPSAVIFDRRVRGLRIGKRVKIRREHKHARWESARVTDLNPLKLALE